MKNKLAYGIVFALGGLVGAGTSYVLTKKKYQKKAEDEIAEVRAAFEEDLIRLQSKSEEFAKKIADLNNRIKGDSPVEYCTEYCQEDDIPEESKEYIVKEEDLTDDEFEQSNGYRRENIFDKYGGKTIPTPIDAEPHVISPAEYLSNEDYSYDDISMTTDKYFLDENDEIITNVVDLIGEGPLSEILADKIDVSVGDAVYVENPRLMSYYEILLVDYTLEEYVNRYNN